MPRTLVWLLPLCACVVPEVEVTPLRGRMPAAIVVLPAIDATGVPGRTLRPLLAGCDRPLRERGYRALPIEVGLDLLAAAGGGDRARLAAAAGVDAALELTVRHWIVDGERALESASWDLQWRLLDLGDGAELWSHVDRGSWQAPRSERPDFTRDPLADPQPPLFGGGPARFADEQELAFALHRQAMLRLPRRP